MIDEAHFRRSNVPMHHPSVIFVVEGFIPSRDSVRVSQCIVINNGSICVFEGDVPCMFGIFKVSLVESFVAFL